MFKVRPEDVKKICENQRSLVISLLEDRTSGTCDFYIVLGGHHHNCPRLANVCDIAPDRARAVARAGIFLRSIRQYAKRAFGAGGNVSGELWRLYGQPAWS